MATISEHIDSKNLPQHIAVIMDGNGRWALKKGAARIFGHRNAIQAVKDITEGCGELGVKYLTLYAFSTENWGRPKEEVEGLMELLVSTLKEELKTLQENKIRLKAIGDIENLPKECQFNLNYAIEATAANVGLTVILALSYSGRWEITNALRHISQQILGGTIKPEDINEQLISKYLNTGEFPDPELLIRTGGEMRVSNFLLWQLAYTEIFITKKLWPDFRKEDLHEAICAYQKRERRFGKVIEQQA